MCIFHAQFNGITVLQIRHSLKIVNYIDFGRTARDLTIHLEVFLKEKYNVWCMENGEGRIWKKYNCPLLVSLPY